MPSWKNNELYYKTKERYIINAWTQQQVFNEPQKMWIPHTIHVKWKYQTISLCLNIMIALWCQKRVLDILYGSSSDYFVNLMALISATRVGYIKLVVTKGFPYIPNYKHYFWSVMIGIHTNNYARSYLWSFLIWIKTQHLLKFKFLVKHGEKELWQCMRKDVGLSWIVIFSFRLKITELDRKDQDFMFLALLFAILFLVSPSSLPPQCERCIVGKLIFLSM